MKVLIVDDSVIFRSQIAAALTGIPHIEVVGSAPNGSIALQRLNQLSVDLVTLDLEMPEMDGIEVLRAIREQKHKVRVIVFSSQTTRGAEKALQALRAGADEVSAKPSEELSQPDSGPPRTPQEKIRDILVPKIMQFLKPAEKWEGSDSSVDPSFSLQPPNTSRGGPEKLPLIGFRPSVIVIASSTGGPTALETIFSSLIATVEAPILIAQHMPPVFTKILSRRLGDLSKKSCDEATHGEMIKPGRVYIAPGDYHLQVSRRPHGVILELDQGPPRNSVRPAADYLFESAATTFGQGCLGIVLTGMGQDGLEGSVAIKRTGGRILIQEEKSCVVFGMPGAVHRANCYDGMGDLDYISSVIQSSSPRVH
jgi:two-component system chemotaxis response regulator CheB